MSFYEIYLTQEQQSMSSSTSKRKVIMPLLKEEEQIGNSFPFATTSSKKLFAQKLDTSSSPSKKLFAQQLDTTSSSKKLLAQKLDTSSPSKKLLSPKKQPSTSLTNSDPFAFNQTKNELPYNTHPSTFVPTSNFTSQHDTEVAIALDDYQIALDQLNLAKQALETAVNSQRNHTHTLRSQEEDNYLAFVRNQNLSSDPHADDNENQFTIERDIHSLLDQVALRVTQHQTLSTSDEAHTILGHISSYLTDQPHFFKCYHLLSKRKISQEKIAEMQQYFFDSWSVLVNAPSFNGSTPTCVDRYSPTSDDGKKLTKQTFPFSPCQVEAIKIINHFALHSRVSNKLSKFLQNQQNTTTPITPKSLLSFDLNQ